jgi:hypothetical protein
MDTSIGIFFVYHEKRPSLPRSEEGRGSREEKKLLN